MRSIIISELREKGSSKPIGYRVSSQANKNMCDFDTSLLEDVVNSLDCYDIVLGKPIYGEFVNDVYLTECESPLTQEVCSVRDWLLWKSKYLNFENSTCDINSLVKLRYLLCRQMLLDIDVPIGAVKDVSVSARLIRSWGICEMHRGSGNFSIRLAERLMLHGDYEAIDLVMLHELLHTCQGCFNHGPKWKYWARTVCDCYNYNISRLTSAETLNISREEINDSMPYACECIGCGQVIGRKSECQFIMYPSSYTCAICGERFKRIR